MHAPLVRRMRHVSLIEGVSFLVLLGIAMPLKYLADQPMAVKIVGWIHGVLFVVLIVLVAQVRSHLKWPLKRSVMVTAAALLPFGPFVIDPKLAALPNPGGSVPSPLEGEG